MKVVVIHQKSVKNVDGLLATVLANMTHTLEVSHLVPGSDTHIQRVLEAKHRGVVQIHMRLGGTVVYSVM